RRDRLYSLLMLSHQQKKKPTISRGLLIKGRQRPDSYRDTLPSRSYRDSTISADGLNYAVRNVKIPAAGTVATVSLRFRINKKKPPFPGGLKSKARHRAIA